MKDDAVYPNNYYEQYEPQWGLTKREYFAAMAMQGIMANPNCEPMTPEHFKNIASDAINIADVLLEELAK